MTLLDTATVEYDGRKFVVETYHDADHGHPWEEYPDIYGVVHERGRGPLRQGERPLHARAGWLFAYDVPATLNKAADERWGPAIEAAIERDYQRLLAYVEERWSYVGVRVTEILSGCPSCGHERHGGTAALWGIESDDAYYQIGGDGLENLFTEAIQETEAS